MNLETKQKLQAVAEKLYFVNGVTEIYVVEGGHFFHVRALSAAREFAGDRAIFLLKKGDNPKIEETVTEETVTEETVTEETVTEETVTEETVTEETVTEETVTEVSKKDKNNKNKN